MPDDVATATRAQRDRSLPARIDPTSYPAEGRVFILSGPSGVGKTTIIRHLREEHFPLGICVTATTRPPRPTEVDGRDYFFLSREEFVAARDANWFMEFSEVHGKAMYGIPVASIRAALRTGNDALVPPEVQGAAIIRSKLRNAVGIFVSPVPPKEIRVRIGGREPESAVERDIQFQRAVREALEARLVARHESVEERRVRLETAVREMERMREYDYVVVNESGHLEECLEQVKAIITAERCRYPRRLDIV
jgi:guanylate kinase